MKNKSNNKIENNNKQKNIKESKLKTENIENKKNNLKNSKMVEKKDYHKNSKIEISTPKNKTEKKNNFQTETNIENNKSKKITDIEIDRKKEQTESENKFLNNTKQFIKDNFKSMILMLLFVIVVNIELPYYIEAPGGTINLTKRIDDDYNKKDGSLNMLYVTQYRGNIVTVLLGQLFPSWDIYEISNQQISNETSKEIYLRNKVMLDNSIQNATFVAYQEAGIEITIKDTKNIVIATTKENGIEIGDNIISVDNHQISNINELKSYLNSKNKGDEVKVILERDEKEKTISITLDEDKILGVAMITNYEYELPKELNINFRNGEGGSSGGLILTLGIYSEITNTDILKGRNIAGTGTIGIEGNIGEIDGVKYKIAGAVKDKMDIVLVSPYNYEEAKKVVEENNYDIELVEVSTFKEAIEYLTK